MAVANANRGPRIFNKNAKTNTTRSNRDDAATADAGRHGLVDPRTRQGDPASSG